MTNAPRRVLHIGQRKTGTSWLQLGFHAATLAGRMFDVSSDVKQWTLSTNWRSATAANFARLSAILPAATDRPSVASCEGLIVYDPTALAEAVAVQWPDAQILVTTRAPQDYVLSSFRNDSFTGHGHAKLFADRFAKRHMMRSHNLDGVASAFGAVFGTDHVHFLPYELLRNDPDAFVSEVENVCQSPLADFLDQTSRNSSPPQAYLFLSRHINAILADGAPDILKSPEWRAFMRLSSLAASTAPGMEERSARFVTAFGVATTLPQISRDDAATLSGRMTVLRNLPRYRPYLERYGLAC